MQFCIKSLPFVVFICWDKIFKIDKLTEYGCINIFYSWMFALFILNPKEKKKGKKETLRWAALHAASWKKTDLEAS